MSPGPDFDDINDIRRRLRRLEAEVAKRPIKVKGGTAVQLRTVTIVSGNTLATGQTGIKYSSSAVTSVPSAYDPSVTSSFVDGIGRGTLFINGVTTSTFVLLLNDSTATPQRPLVAGDVVAVQSTVDIAVSGGGGTTVSVYPVLFL